MEQVMTLSSVDVLIAIHLAIGMPNQAKRQFDLQLTRIDKFMNSIKAYVWIGRK
jgi:hypothetical protein